MQPRSKGRALLKLDVQGFELAALQGCTDVLDRFEFVYVEVSFIELYVGQALASDVVAFLLGRNFKLLCVANPHLAGRKGRFRPISCSYAHPLRSAAESSPPGDLRTARTPGEKKRRRG